MTFDFIDIFFLIIILFCAINATLKGFVHELFSKTAFFLGIFIATIFFRKLAPFLDPYINIVLINQIIAFVVIFILVYLLVRLIQQAVKNFFDGDIMKGLDKALGFFFGIAEGLVLVSLVLVILYVQPWFNVTNLLQDSFFNNLLKGVLSTPTEYVRGFVHV